MSIVAHPIIAIDGLSASGKGTLAKKLAHHFGFAHLDTGKLYRLVGLMVRRHCAVSHLTITTLDHHTLEQMALPVAEDIAARLLRLLDDKQQPDDNMGGEHLWQALWQQLTPAPENEITAPLQTTDEKINTSTATTHHRAAAELAADATAEAASLIARHPNVRQALRAAQVAFGHHPSHPGAVIDGRDIGTVIFPDAAVKLYITASAAVRAERRFLELQSLGIYVSRDAILEELGARDQADKTRIVAPLKAAADAIVLDSSSISADQLFQQAIAIIQHRNLFSPPQQDK